MNTRVIKYNRIQGNVYVYKHQSGSCTQRGRFSPPVQIFIHGVLALVSGDVVRNKRDDCTRWKQKWTIKYPFNEGVAISDVSVSTFWGTTTITNICYENWWLENTKTFGGVLLETRWDGHKKYTGITNFNWQIWLTGCIIDTDILCHMLNSIANWFFT